MIDRFNYAVEMLPLDQVIMRVTEVVEIGVSVMVEDIINVGLWETLPKLTMERAIEIGPGHLDAETVMMGIHQFFGQ